MAFELVNKRIHLRFTETGVRVSRRMITFSKDVPIIEVGKLYLLYLDKENSLIKIEETDNKIKGRKISALKKQDGTYGTRSINFGNHIIQDGFYKLIKEEEGCLIFGFQKQ